MNKKLIIGIVAVVVLGGVGYYLYRRSKNQPIQEEDDIQDAIVVDETEETQALTKDVKKPALAKNQYLMGYLSNRTGGIVPVHFASPRPKKGTFKKNSNVAIGNTKFDGNYTVHNVWIDKSGNLGAIYLKIKGYTPTGKTDRTFENIGTITKI